MKLIKKLAVISILLAFILSGVALAKPVDKINAENMVKGWLKTNPKPLNSQLGNQIAETEVYNGPDGKAAYYIVYLNPSGFLIVSADDLIEPVVGFVNGEALYDPSPENPLGALVSRDLPGRVAAAKQGKIKAGDAAKAQDKWSKHVAVGGGAAPMSLGGVSDVRVAPLVQTKWGQDYVCNDTLLCYNYYTPNHWYCGCTATAMAQIVRYMQYPTAGIGVHHIGSYDTRGGDGSGGPYNYNLMIYQPGCDATEAQRQQIGALCFDVGVAAYMDYGSGGSGAYIHDAKAAFITTLMYSNAVIGGNESTNIGAGLNGMVNPSLDAGIPVQFGIYGPGHSVVCDGYGYQSSTLYHHVNMGWDGYNDAWYELPAIDTFTMVDSCIYNIYTTGSGEIISGRATYNGGQPFAGASVTATGPGGPYSTTTNMYGIYAFAKVSSNSTYTISVSAAGCTFTPSSQNAVTGTSTDAAITSGNVWGVNFSTTCAPPPPPPAPASVSYPTSSTGQYTVSWPAASTATSYQLERSSNGGGSWAQVYSGANLFYPENIGNGSYRYRVAASNAGGSSGWTTGTWDCVVYIPPAISTWLKGDIHYHTTNSDGSETVATMVTGYRDTGMHAFSCITDHDYISDASAYSTGTFVGVNGVEASTSAHCVGFGVTGSGSFNGGATLQAEIDAIRSAGGVPMVAHPQWSHDNMSYDMPTLLNNMTNCNLMSIYNWYCQDLWGNGNSEAYWDTLLTNGKVIYGYAEDDTHGLGRQGFTFDRVGVAPADLTLANIKTALQNGTFYFGRNVTRWAAGITVSSYTFSSTGPGGIINIATSGADTIQFIGTGGSVLQTTTASSAAYTIAGSEQYVRIKATNAAGDITWLQPVFITGGGGAPPTPASITYPASSSTGVYSVSWASSSGATSYQLERSSNGGADWGQIYSGANTSFSENIGSGSYRYRVKATNSNGSSLWRTGTTDCVVNVAPIEGYAPLATGGAGGTVVHITNLADSGAGSLRAAIGALTGSPTIIVFDVGGVICVSGEIRMSKGNVTIDGASTPSPGITLAGAAGTMFGIDVDNDANVIIRHVRFRNAGLEDLQIWEGGKITVDHCSFSGSGDGAFDINTANHLVISRCIFANCTEVHKAHGTYVSVHHNLYAWNNRRQPRIFGAGPYWDFRNNVMEYWTNSGTNVLGSDAVNIVNNYYGDPSPMSTCNTGFWSINDATNVYTGGNYSHCGQNIDAMGNRGTPNLEPTVTTIPAADVLANVLADVGAQPNDAIDQYYIAGGGTTPPPVGGCGGGGGPILEWIGPNGTASPWEAAANWEDLDTGATRVPTNNDIARLYNALVGQNFTDSNVTVSSTTATCLKLQMRYLITKLTILTGGKLTTTGSVEMQLGTSAQLDIQSGATIDACTKTNTSTATFKLSNDAVTTGPATVNIWGTLNIVSLNPTNGTSDLQICNVSGGTGPGTINIYSAGILNTEAYTIGSYGTGRIYVSAGGTMKVTGNVTTQVNADISAGKIAGAGGATLTVTYNSGENKTYVTATGGGSPPPVPGSITYPTTSSTGQYTVSWASSTGATSYQLERSSNGGGSWGQIYSGANTSFPENITNGSYRYRVKATNANGSSGYRTGTYDCVVTISQWSETADYYVDYATGLDTNPGSSSQPYKTITKAITVATAGKKVLVWGGQTYTGALTLSKSGTSASPITFKRDPASGAATINGNGTTNGALYSTTASYNTFDGFTLTNGRYGFYNYGAANGLIVKNCRITANTQHGVYIRSGDNHTLFNDAIYTNGSAYAGVYVYSSALNNNVTQCSIYNQKWGVRYASSCTGGVITNSIIANHTTNGVLCETSSTATITYTDNWSNYINYSGCSAGTGCISANPLWVSPSTGDFHLQAGSPCDNTASDGGDMGYRYSTSAL